MPRRAAARSCRRRDASVQPSGRGVELAADGGEPAAQIAGLETQAQRPELAFAPREGVDDDAAQLMRQLGGVTSTHREPGGEARESAAAAEPVETRPAPIEPGAHGGAQSP